MADKAKKDAKKATEKRQQEVKEKLKACDRLLADSLRSLCRVVVRLAAAGTGLTRSSGEALAGWEEATPGDALSRGRGATLGETLIRGRSVPEEGLVPVLRATLGYSSLEVQHEHLEMTGV